MNLLNPFMARMTCVDPRPYPHVHTKGKAAQMKRAARPAATSVSPVIPCSVSANRIHCIRESDGRRCSRGEASRLPMYHARSAWLHQSCGTWLPRSEADSSGFPCVTRRC